MHKIVVVVPAYNEAERISAAVTALVELRERFREMDMEYLVYVVDDGSRDGTADLAREAGADRILRHHTNRGLGAAVRTGLTAARDEGADLAVKIDADLQHDPTDIFPLIQPILDDKADLVYGNRFERIEYAMPLVRRTGNRVFTALMRRLTGWPIRDSQPGIFAAGRAYLDRFYLPGDYNYTQQILLDARYKGMRFAQVPVSFRKRRTGKSFVSLAYPFKVLPQLLQVLVAVRPFKLFGPLGGASLLLSLGVVLWDLGGRFRETEAGTVPHGVVALLLLLFGIQVLLLGLIADWIARTHRK